MCCINSLRIIHIPNGLMILSQTFFEQLQLEMHAIYGVQFLLFHAQIMTIG